jgi:hypothetical protein
MHPKGVELSKLQYGVPMVELEEREREREREGRKWREGRGKKEREKGGRVTRVDSQGRASPAWVTICRESPTC